MQLHGLEPTPLIIYIKFSIFSWTFKRSPQTPQDPKAFAHDHSICRASEMFPRIACDQAVGGNNPQDLRVWSGAGDDALERGLADADRVDFLCHQLRSLLCFHKVCMFSPGFLRRGQGRRLAVCVIVIPPLFSWLFMFLYFLKEFFYMVKNKIYIFSVMYF